jgi:hypothetical protein
MNRTTGVGRHTRVIPEAPGLQPWGVVTVHNDVVFTMDGDLHDLLRRLSKLSCFHSIITRYLVAFLSHLSFFLREETERFKITP